MRRNISSAIIFFIVFFNAITYSSRRDDGGNLKNVSYHTQAKDEIDNNLSLNIFLNKFSFTFRGMSYIKGCEGYRIGSMQHNPMSNIPSINIAPFLIDKTVLTVAEFNKLIKILIAFYKNGGRQASDPINLYVYTSHDAKDKDEDEGQYDTEFHLSDEDVYNMIAKNKEGEVDKTLDGPVREYLELRSDFASKVVKPEYIYDMLPWMSNQDEEYNKFLEEYYTDPKNANKPAIGLNWEQCVEIAKLRTVYCNEYLINTKKIQRDARFIVKFSLPNYGQWCLAAEGSEGICLYGWGSIALTDSDGRVCGNFSNPSYENGGVYVTDVNTFRANTNGLYDMSGNVYEWLNENDSKYTSRQDADEIRMVIGGSYASYSEELEIGKYYLEHELASKPTIGVRFVAEIFQA